MSDTEQEKIKAKSVLLGIFASGVFTVIVAVIGVASGYLEFLNRDRGHDIELAKISLNILAGEYNTDDEDRSPLPARRFALRALEASTGVEIEEQDFEAWVTSGATPLAPESLTSTGALRPEGSLCYNTGGQTLCLSTGPLPDVPTNSEATE